MPESLLDTYTAERRPVAEAVLANTLAQTAIMRPDPQSAAMRDVVAKLLRFDDANRFLGEMISGLGVRYDLGSDLSEVGRLVADRPVGGVNDRVSLYGLMQDGCGVFLDATTGAEASRFVQSTAVRVRCATVEKGPSMLVRPDACVAWVGGTEDVAGWTKHCSVGSQGRELDLGDDRAGLISPLTKNSPMKFDCNGAESQCSRKRRQLSCSALAADIVEAP